MVLGPTEDGVGADRYTGAELPVLRALLHISDAVLRAQYFDEVLEVIADQARVALRAATVSICRMEPELSALRILHNAGRLAPQEQRWPQNDLYPVAPDSTIHTLLAKGIAYANSLDDPGCPVESREVLTSLGKESEVAAPVMVGGSMWGTLWVTGVDGRRFDDGDILLLQAIAAQTALAIGRSELLSTVWRYAFEDPLTGIANRRAIDQRLAEIDWDTTYPVVLMCDLDDFKRINDRNGHPAGDDLLRVVATELKRLTETIDGAFAGRLGGDEFCVLLPDATLVAAQIFALDATKALRSATDLDVTLSWGAAAAGPQVRSGSDLLAAADAALLEAKRQGPARFSTGMSTPVVHSGLDRRARDVKRTAGVTELVGDLVTILDEQPDLTTVGALEVLAVQVQQVLGTAAWALSECGEDRHSLRSLRSVDSVLHEDSGLSVLTDLGPSSYALADYPASARAVSDGTAFVAAVDLENSDPAEKALVTQLGYRAVLGVGVPAGSTSYLLEFFSRDGHRDLVEIAPLVRVLASYCVSRVSGTR